METMLRGATLTMAAAIAAGVGCDTDLSGLSSGGRGGSASASASATTTTGTASASGAASGSGGTSISAGSTGAGASNGYPTAVMADGPLSYWRLDEAAGTTAKDSAGANDGSYVGGVTLGASGAISGDGAAHFDGVDGQVVVGDVFDFANNAPFTVELWARPDQLNASWYHRLVSKEFDDSQGNQGWVLWATTSAMQLLRRRGASTESATYAMSLMTGVWTHVVATYDGTNVQLYVDGMSVGYGAGANVQLGDGTGALCFARAASGNGPFIGSLDEIAIYDKALSPAAIAAHYAAALQ